MSFNRILLSRRHEVEGLADLQLLRERQAHIAAKAASAASAAVEKVKGRMKPLEEPLLDVRNQDGGNRSSVAVDVGALDEARGRHRSNPLVRLQHADSAPDFAVLTALSEQQALAQVQHSSAAVLSVSILSSPPRSAVLPSLRGINSPFNGGSTRRSRGAVSPAREKGAGGGEHVMGGPPLFGGRSEMTEGGFSDDEGGGEEEEEEEALDRELAASEGLGSGSVGEQKQQRRMLLLRMRAARVAARGVEGSLFAGEVGRSSMAEDAALDALLQRSFPRAAAAALTSASNASARLRRRQTAWRLVARFFCILSAGLLCDVRGEDDDEEAAVEAAKSAVHRRMTRSGVNVPIVAEPHEDVGGCCGLLRSYVSLDVSPLHASSQFLFHDYEPHLFARLRTLAGIGAGEYVHALSRTRREKFSEGASGAFLYFSLCERFIVKTLSRSEADVFLGASLLRFAPTHASDSPLPFLSRHAAQLRALPALTPPLPHHALPGVPRHHNVRQHAVLCGHGECLHHAWRSHP